MKKAVFFGIDYQVDFMDLPGSSLGVPGAIEDATRIASFITKFANDFHRLYFTQDSHHVLDIAHPKWWRKKEQGKPDTFIEPYKMVTPDKIANGEYYPVVSPASSIKYINDLASQGEFIHTIWPEHCVIGTPGHAFHPAINAAIAYWESTTHRWVNYVTKGSNPFTEHFGAIRANIPQANDPSTQLNQSLLNELQQADVIYFTGEARSHCVANTLRQLMQEVPNLIPKMVILPDGMSDVLGLPNDFYTLVDGIYNQAKTMGAQFAKTTEISSL